MMVRILPKRTLVFHMNCSNQPRFGYVAFGQFGVEHVCSQPGGLLIVTGLSFQ